MELAELGLEEGMTVLFLPGRNRRWRPAKVLGLEADGSIRLSDNGTKRAIRTNRIKRQSLGPRGGIRWELIDDTNRDSEAF